MTHDSDPKPETQDWNPASVQNQEYVIPFLEPDDPFPPVERALPQPNGLLAAGADLSPARLLDAYAHGIFPWFGEDDPLLWWSPDPRMVLCARADVHVSRSLRKTMRSGRLQVTLAPRFPQVIEGCAEPRRVRTARGSREEMPDAYCQLFDLGHAHSIEVWVDDDLVGGLYGVALGRMFFGESMFSRDRMRRRWRWSRWCAQLERWGLPLHRLPDGDVAIWRRLARRRFRARSSSTRSAASCNRTAAAVAVAVRRGSSEYNGV